MQGGWGRVLQPVWVMSPMFLSLNGLRSKPLPQAQKHLIYSVLTASEHPQHTAGMETAGSCTQGPKEGSQEQPCPELFLSHTEPLQQHGGLAQLECALCFATTDMLPFQWSSG